MNNKLRKIGIMFLCMVCSSVLIAQQNPEAAIEKERSASSKIKANSAESEMKESRRINSEFGDNELRLTSPKLLINGLPTKMRGNNWNGVIGGSALYAYIPGKGRFIFTLSQQNSSLVQKNASLENNKISFEFDGEKYELISEEPIISSKSGSNPNMWVLHDPSYKPNVSFNSDSITDFVQYGATGSVEYMLTKNPLTRPENNSPSVQRELESMYQKWLSQDVLYIITDEEKQTFSTLETNSEREKFIISFWQRRDTKPETKTNEFRRDHYKRIAFANENFAFGEMNGWRTDRGRIYIKYGKPDEVQQLQSGEIWIYNNVPELGNNNSFEFVKAGEKVDFRLKR